MIKITAKIFCVAMLFSVFLTMGIFVSPVRAEGTCKCPDNSPSTKSCNSDTDCENIQCTAGAANGTCGGATGGTGSTTGGTPAAGKLTNPLSAVCSDKTSGQQCVQLIIGNIIKAALGIVGSIALLMMTYGGYRWLTAMGNSEKVEKGKDTVIWAALGLALIFGAYAITNYIITKLLSGGK